MATGESNNRGRSQSRETAVILISMGGPRDKTEIRPFLQNLFNDSHIISLPQPLRFAFSQLMASARYKKALGHYRAIGGGSPLIEWTRKQAALLSEKLNDRIPGCIVTTAYSYSPPLIKDTLKQLSRMRPKRIVAVPLYPQYSVTTYGSVESDLRRSIGRLGLKDRLIVVPPFYDHYLYIEISADYLKKALDYIDASQPYRVVFTAHSLPRSVIEKGDPYQDQVERSVSLIAEKADVADFVIGYQSRLGPVKWLEPSTIGCIRQAAGEGIRQVVLMPIGFVCDHIETLYELDIELGEIARVSGITNFTRADVFNDDRRFIDLLGMLIEEAIHE